MFSTAVASSISNLENGTRQIADYDAALKVNPELPTSLYGRGQAKLKNSSGSEGDADITAAKRIRPSIVEEFTRYGFLISLCISWL
jgi:hypothetical protein